MAEIHSVSLYEINSHSSVEMSQDHIISFVNENASRIFIDNISINEGEILSIEINVNSNIEIVCEGSRTTGDPNVILYRPCGEIVHQRMTKSDVLEEINGPQWLFVDRVMVPGIVNLPINENSEIKIVFNEIPHAKVLIENHDYPPEQEFRTRIADATGGTFGSHTLGEINKMIPAPDVIVDGEMISFPITAVQLHEQSLFNFLPALRSGCNELDCSCGGKRRHDFRRITQGLVNKGKSDNGCWSAEQLCLLGITDEYHLGDQENIQNRIGNLITAGNWEKFVNLKNCHLEE
jgi:hypothetical protein